MLRGDERIRRNIDHVCFGWAMKDNADVRQTSLCYYTCQVSVGCQSCKECLISKCFVMCRYAGYGHVRHVSDWCTRLSVDGRSTRSSAGCGCSSCRNASPTLRYDDGGGGGAWRRSHGRCRCRRRRSRRTWTWRLDGVERRWTTPSGFVRTSRRRRRRTKSAAARRWNDARCNGRRCCGSHTGHSRRIEMTPSLRLTTRAYSRGPLGGFGDVVVVSGKWFLSASHHRMNALRRRQSPLQPGTRSIVKILSIIIAARFACDDCAIYSTSTRRPTFGRDALFCSALASSSRRWLFSRRTSACVRCRPEPGYSACCGPK